MSSSKRKDWNLLVPITIVVLIIAAAVIIYFDKRAEADAGTLEKASSTVIMPYDRLQTMGPEDAVIKLVEFGDIKCPTCKYFSDNLKPQLVKDFVDTGRASFSFVDFPFIGPDSTTAALTAKAVFIRTMKPIGPI